MDQSQRRVARVRGMSAAAVGLTIWWVAGAISSGAPLPAAALGDAVIRATPGAIATFFIEALGHWAMRLLTVGGFAAMVLFGGELSVRASRTWVAAAIFALMSAAIVAISPVLADPGPTAVAAVLAAAGFWVVARPPRAPDPSELDLGRRGLVRAAVIGAGVVVVGGGAAAWLLRRLGGPDTDVSLVAPASPAAPPGGREPFPDIAGLSPEVTPTDEHYVVDIDIFDPSVEASDWRLEVTGSVDEPLSLSFDELQQRFEVVEEYSVLCCISNEVGGDLIGNSAWGGVRLRDILAAAGAGDRAVDVVFHAADGYSDSIPVELAMEPVVLVALSQNSRPLTQEHGFPCRLRIPAIYGMKNVKWLTKIEVVERDHLGYWQERGWSDDATVRTQSRIDVAGDDGSARRGEQTWIAGIAWAGARGISKVEVSTDGGRTWAEAMLKDPLAPNAWRLWAYRWTPERAGTTRVVCRATDGDGKVQTAATAPPHPAGATGYHEVEVSVA